jgi:transmembrane sensor
MSADLPSPQALAALGPARGAALWLERLQRDDPDQDDDAFGRWLASSDANQQAWARALDLWDAFDEPEADETLGGLRAEALTLRGSRPAAVGGFWYAAAASIAAVAVLGVLVANFGGDALRHRPSQVADAGPPDLRAFGRPDYVTAVGQRSAVRLADGTRVELDTNSALDVAYDGGRRSVRLVRGQAFFDVVHDAAHPFRVAAGGRVVTDVGTRFDIRLQGDQTRILLMDGAVRVTPGDDPSRAPSGQAQTLSPGQELIVRAGQADEIVRADVERAADWRRGVVQFDNTSLAEAVSELNRYTSRPLVIRDAKVGALRISGAFRTGDTARFAETLQTLYPVRVTPLGNGQMEIVARP